MKSLTRALHFTGYYIFHYFYRLYNRKEGDAQKRKEASEMKNHDIIFIIGIITILVGNKLWEMFESFDMAIDPIGTTIKMIVLFVITMKLIKHIFRTEREKARN